MFRRSWYKLRSRPRKCRPLRLRQLRKRKRSGQEFRIEDNLVALQPGDRLAKRYQRRLAAFPLDLKQVARAEILDGDHLAEHLPLVVDAGESKQVGVIIFALIELR